MRNESGYIALISAIIIGAVLLIAATGLSTSNSLSRVDTQRLQFKEVSRNVAEGCLDYVRYKMSAGAYSGSETITIDTYPCQILAIESSGSQKIIKVTAGVQNVSTNLKLTVDSTTLAKVSLEELSSF